MGDDGLYHRERMCLGWAYKNELFHHMIALEHMIRTNNTYLVQLLIVQFIM